MGIGSIFCARVLDGSNSAPGGIFYIIFLEINHEYSQTILQKKKNYDIFIKAKIKKIYIHIFCFNWMNFKVVSFCWKMPSFLNFQQTNHSKTNYFQMQILCCIWKWFLNFCMQIFYYKFCFIKKNTPEHILLK